MATGLLPSRQARIRLFIAVCRIVCLMLNACYAVNGYFANLPRKIFAEIF